MTQKYKEYSFDALQFEMSVRAQLINEMIASAKPLQDELQLRTNAANDEASKAPTQLELFDK